MRKRVFGHQLSRTKNQRKALFRGLIASLIKNGQLKTTLAKGRATRPAVEKLITKAKRATLNDRRQILKFLQKRSLVNRLCDVIAPVFKEKKGGYTRMIKVGRRKGDSAEMVKLMFTEDIPLEMGKEESKDKEEVSAEGKKLTLGDKKGNL